MFVAVTGESFSFVFAVQHFDHRDKKKKNTALLRVAFISNLCLTSTGHNTTAINAQEELDKKKQKKLTKVVFLNLALGCV